MSVEAITWALQQPIKRSSTKFVLVVLANCASRDVFIAWPSMGYLAKATGQDRKTVQAGLNSLREQGYITDTGERKGLTKQVIVYRVSMTDDDIVKHVQKRNSTENGTVPKKDRNSTKFPREQYRFLHETVPKTGLGTVKNHKELSGNKNKPGALALPDWVPAESWAMWDRFRKQKSGKSWTEDAKRLSIRTLEKLRGAGNDPTAVIEQAVERGWTGLFDIREPNAATTQAPSRADRHANWNERLNKIVDATLQPERPKVIDMGAIDASS